MGLKANFDVVLGIDKDPSALAVYRMHHEKGMELDLGDIQRSIKIIRDVGPIQLLAVSSPQSPCTPLYLS